MKNLTTTSIALAMSFFMCFGLIHAQEKTITGTVVDQTGLPLPGTNIIIKGTNVGAQTDFDGAFSLEASNGDVLSFSYIGFNTQEVVVGETANLYVTMIENTDDLEEIVLIGYGRSSTKRISTSIASIKGEELKAISTPSLQSLMTSKIPGVQITQITGRVESGIKVRVRGVSTISASQEPLYILDGVPLINDDESVNNSPINPLIGLNPDDIESIDFLKDASSAAIYGSRGTNGVILIETKKGSESKPKVTFTTSTGINRPTNRRDFMNSDEYVEFFTEAALNSGMTLAEIETRFDELALGRDWRNGEAYTNWQHLALQENITTNIGVSASGGSDKVQYYLSSSYNKTGGVVVGNELDRYTFRAKVDANISENSKIGANIGLSKVSLDRLSNDNTFQAPLQSVSQSPLTPALLDDGTANVDGTSTLYQNFLGQLQTGRFVTTIWRNTGNMYGDFYLNEWLRWKSELGYDINTQGAERFSGSLTEFASAGGVGTVTNAVTERFITTHYLSVDHTFGNSFDFSATLGGSYEETNRKSQFTSGQGFLSDDLQTLDNAVLITDGGSNKLKYSFLSYFARTRMSLSKKYLLNLSIRQDGGSVFGANSRTGWFPAASAAWIVSDEGFLIGSSFLSNLKFRGSWGITGNADIPDTASFTLLQLDSYGERFGSSALQIGNNDLRWEKTTQYNVGVDYGFFNNTITGQVDYYNKTTNDLLYSQPLPATSGFTSVFTNVGELVNTGIEASITAKILSKPSYTWNATALFTKNQNEITSLPGGDIIDGVNILREGEAISSFYLYEYAGVDPATGDALFFENSENADGTLNKNVTNDITNANRIIAGSPFPDYQVAFSNTLRIKNWDLDFTFQGEFGASIFDQAGKFTSGNGFFLDNQTIDQLDRWQNPGDITDVPQARLNEENGQQDSTRYLDQADFIRLRNVTLGYTMYPEASNKLNIEKVRFYFNGVNLLTFTDYEGYDPESTADFNGNSGVRTGVSFYSPPPAKTFSLGIQVDF